jgi:hypothetical protein
MIVFSVSKSTVQWTHSHPFQIVSCLFLIAIALARNYRMESSITSCKQTCRRRICFLASKYCNLASVWVPVKHQCCCCRVVHYFEAFLESIIIGNGECRLPIAVRYGYVVSGSASVVVCMCDITTRPVLMPSGCCSLCVLQLYRQYEFRKLLCKPHHCLPNFHLVLVINK